MPSVEAQIRFVTASGLRHRVVEWDGGGQTTVVLVHGFLDCGGSFGPLVAHLPEGLHCVAPDLRGHGGTDRVGPGGYYHFVDYVRDLRHLVDQLKRERLILIGHSMGGGVSTLFTGSWPDEVERLVLLEGLGPPKEDVGDGPERMRRWVREVDAVRSGRKSVSRFDSLDAAAARLRAKDDRVGPERALELARWLTEPHPEGGLRWNHDALHRTRNPLVYRPATWEPFLDAISCPVLTVSAGRSWYRWPDLPARRARLADHRHLRYEEATHMLHHDVPELLGRAITDFLDGLEPEGAA